MKKTDSLKNYNWINVYEEARKIDPSFDITGEHDVSDVVQKVLEGKKFCSFYFPKGTYLFEKGITLSEEIVLQGEANIGVPANISMDPISGATNFITHVKHDMSIIHIKEKKQCIKNINFYSDSFQMKKNDRIPTNGQPGYHYEKVDKGNTYGKVNAITHYEDLENHGGLGHFENLYFHGFSGIGFEIPYYAIANHLTVSNCNIGLDVGIDSIITDSRVSDCVIGIDISTGATLTSIRIERMQKFGIISRYEKGWGSYKLNNITIDECGYCGIYMYQLFNCNISAIITRCGQYFYQTDKETFQSLLEKEQDKNEKAEKSSAYSLIYGNLIADSSFEILGSNEVTWEQHVSSTPQKLSVFHCDYILRSIAKSTLENDANIYSVTKGNSLRYMNQYGSVLFTNTNQIPTGYGGINTEYKMDERLIRASGTMFRIRDNDKEVESYYTSPALVVASVNNDIEQIPRSYGEGRANNLNWTLLGSEKIGNDTVYYFKS